MTEGAHRSSVQAPARRAARLVRPVLLEVVDESTGEPVPEGEVGTLVVTPLWNNNVTPFLRWNSGDLVSISRTGEAATEPWSVFPVMRHARRTVGFFKVRGVNINHAELEDLMFFDADVTDFKAEAARRRDRPGRAASVDRGEARRRCRKAAPSASATGVQDFRDHAGIGIPRAGHSRQANSKPASRRRDSSTGAVDLRGGCHVGRSSGTDDSAGRSSVSRRSRRQPVAAAGAQGCVSRLSRRKDRRGRDFATSRIGHPRSRRAPGRGRPASDHRRRVSTRFVVPRFRRSGRGSGHEGCAVRFPRRRPGQVSVRLCRRQAQTRARHHDRRIFVCQRDHAPDAKSDHADVRASSISSVATRR